MDALKPGWLQRQLDAARADFETWPEWMKRESGVKQPPTPKRQPIMAYPTDRVIKHVEHQVQDDRGLLFEVERVNGRLYGWFAVKGRVVVDGKEYEAEERLRVRLKPTE